MSLQDEARVFRTILWPLIRKDLARVRMYYLGFLPRPLMSRFLERDLRRELDEGVL